MVGGRGGGRKRVREGGSERERGDRGAVEHGLVHSKEIVDRPSPANRWTKPCNRWTKPKDGPREKGTGDRGAVKHARVQRHQHPRLLAGLGPSKGNSTKSWSI